MRDVEVGMDEWTKERMNAVEVWRWEWRVRGTMSLCI
jgi:hypothetical protein